MQISIEFRLFICSVVFQSYFWQQAFMYNELLLDLWILDLLSCWSRCFFLDSIILGMVTVSQGKEPGDEHMDRVLFLFAGLELWFSLFRCSELCGWCVCWLHLRSFLTWKFGWAFLIWWSGSGIVVLFEHGFSFMQLFCWLLRWHYLDYECSLFLCWGLEDEFYFCPDLKKLRTLWILVFSENSPILYCSYSRRDLDLLVFAWLQCIWEIGKWEL